MLLPSKLLLLLPAGDATDALLTNAAIIDGKLLLPKLLLMLLKADATGCHFRTPPLQMEKLLLSDATDVGNECRHCGDGSRCRSLELQILL
jgi:hypothetical protein